MPDHHFHNDTNLLSLPPEIRSLIYERLLSGSNRYILSPSSRPKYYHRDYDLHPAPEEASGGSHVHPAANLLLTCHLVRREIQTAIALHMHLYCSVHELEYISTSSYLPSWLRNSLRHVSIYKFDLTRSHPLSPIQFFHPFTSTRDPLPLDSAHQSFSQSIIYRLLADHTSAPHAKLLRTFPALARLDLVYFWPEILGRMKHRLELFFEGRRDDELLSLVQIAFRRRKDEDDISGGIWRDGAVEKQCLRNDEALSSQSADSARTNRMNENQASTSPSPSQLQIFVTGHFIETEASGPNGRRCLVSSLSFA
ncbi:uncharacterized protein Z518_04130 [Rhinocladiella mackenziei CBS 650.93]|uniref:Uncharacterized protein n=1 Tax=Rhinocladiella mackenziei CBS 650.93 TaxID=1442369 RepID=A0A0D2ISM2_9EURO|nr:uncharacterized protein Z518_04130 [Rhinocladiella mackenziei CBS 650.93]KIX06156.1 hypothetical protein Z518_04130 [Rhinocladiella mackenziei CBS 650.93]